MLNTLKGIVPFQFSLKFLLLPQQPVLKFRIHFIRFNCSTCGDIFVSEYDVIEHKAQAHAGSAIDEDEGNNMCK